MWKTLFLSLLLITLSACSHSHFDRIPASYQKQELPEADVSDKNPPAKLQILVTRSFLYSSHSALRLLYKGKLLMWDPSGSYGNLDEHKEYFSNNPLSEKYNRINDLVIDGAPSLPSYFHFAQYTQDNEMEVFEWVLTEEVAAYYHDLLVQGATNENNLYGFSTHHAFYLCSSYLTRILKQYMGKTFQLSDTYFFPDSLAHELFQHKPDRIFFFARQKPVTIFSK